MGLDVYLKMFEDSSASKKKQIKRKTEKLASKIGIEKMMTTKKLQKPIFPPIIVFYCSKCGEQLRPSIAEKWFDIKSGNGCANFIWKCPKAGLFNKIIDFAWQGHTTLLTTEHGTELQKYSGL